MNKIKVSWTNAYTLNHAVNDLNHACLLKDLLKGGLSFELSGQSKFNSLTPYSSLNYLLLLGLLEVQSDQTYQFIRWANWPKFIVYILNSNPTEDSHYPVGDFNPHLFDEVWMDLDNDCNGLNPRVNEMLKCAVLMPTLLVLAKHFDNSSLIFDPLSIHPGSGSVLKEIFLALGLVRKQDDVIFYTETGQHLIAVVAHLEHSKKYRSPAFEQSQSACGLELISIDSFYPGGGLSAPGNPALSGLKSIMAEVFDKDGLGDQPKYLAVWGIENLPVIRVLFDEIITNTKRGFHLHINPLTLIIIDSSPEKDINIKDILSPYPHLYIEADLKDTPTIFKIFLQREIDIKNVLFIASISNSIMQSNNVFTDVKEELRYRDKQVGELLEAFSKLINKHGLILAEIHFQNTGLFDKEVDVLKEICSVQYQLPETFKITAANTGLFTDKSGSYASGCLPDIIYSQSYYRKRGYVIRRAKAADLVNLMELEELCWPIHSRLQESEVKRRLSVYPEGQFVIVDNGHVLGNIFTQRANDESELYLAGIETVGDLHTPDGKFVQLLSINVHPAYQDKSLGNELLEFILQLSSVLPGIEHVYAISKCKNFKGRTISDYSNYLKQTDDYGLLRDPILRFHQLHGGKVVGIVENYRPEDYENIGNGVLIKYDLTDRESPGLFRSENENTLSSGVGSGVLNKVKTYIKSLLQDANDIDIDRPLMEMGLDSGDLLSLGAFIGKNFDITVESSFFFEHNTIRSFVAQLSKNLEVPPKQFSFPGAESEVKSEPVRYQQAVTLNEKSGTTGDGNDIAIIGTSFRVPGASTRDELWDLLSQGKSVITDLPPERWVWPDWINVANDHKGIDKGGFLKDIDKFDAAFFRISPLEAELIDPQQRLLLELTHELLEEAGYKPSSLKGSKTGVFIGASGCDYDLLLKELNRQDTLTGTGTALSVLANRISYFYDFEGPSLVIDTACSSSLVGIHEAIKALKSGEVSLSIVGGIHLMCHPYRSMAYYQAKMLSPDAKCQSFDNKANGYVRSEGAVLMLLKPYALALKDGDQILGIIKGSAINHGGQSGGLTVPNPEKQRKLLEDAYTDAKTAIYDVSYIEAHGTGTSLGDPIEIAGLIAAFNTLKERHTERQQFIIPGQKWCGVGSIKTNIGHLEAGAGLAGILKVLLSMEKRLLPANVHFDQLNKKINLDKSPFYILDQLIPWKLTTGQGPLIAGVSSFGIGGMNAHVVLQSFDRSPSSTIGLKGDQETFLFILSAKDDERLIAYASKMRGFLTLNKDIDVYALCYSLQVAKEEMDSRLALVFHNLEELIKKLSQFIEGVNHDNYFTNSLKNKDNRIDEDIDSTALTFYLQQKSYIKLAQSWIKGARINWAEQYTSIKPKRINLPAYPFARERYWVPLWENQTEKTIAHLKRAHPLMHLNVPYLPGQELASSFNGHEDFFTDHQVSGKKVFPGVAYLELAREAGQRNKLQAINQLRDITWLKPIQVEDSSIKVSIRFHQLPNEEMSYEIFTKIGETIQTHCQGKLSEVAVQEPLSFDINKIRRRLTRSKSKTECYAMFRDIGLDYGPSFQAIDSLYYNENEAISRISIPIQSEYLLQPGLLDCTFQTCICWHGFTIENFLELPFSVEELNIYGKISNSTWCHVSRREQNKPSQPVSAYDIHLLDENGAVLLRITRFVMLPFNKSIEKHSSTSHPLIIDNHQINQTGLFLPRWEETNIKNQEAAKPFKKYVFVTGKNPNRLASQLSDHFNEQGHQVEIVQELAHLSNSVTDVYLLQGLATSAVSISLPNDLEVREESVFLTFKSLQRNRSRDSELNITVITLNTQKVLLSDEVSYLGAGITGLVGAIVKEYFNWNTRIIDIPSVQLNDNDLKKILSIPFNNETIFGYRNGKLFKLEYRPIALTGGHETKLKAGGTYVILGGTGGLGRVTTEFLIKQYNAQVIWLGRSELNNVIIEFQNDFSKLGKRPLYVQCDIIKKDSVEMAYQEIKSAFKEINGLFHSALVLNDMTIENMGFDDFKKAFLPKSIGSHYFIEAFQNEELDFVCFYSSFLSQFNVAGQANYAAGCSFKDSYAHHLSIKNSFAVQIINWGYWGDVGIVSSDYYKKRMEMMGVGGISSREGMAMLEMILSNKHQQVMAIKLTPDHSLGELFNVKRGLQVAPQNSSFKIMPDMEFTKSSFNQELKDKFNRVCHLAVLGVLLELGFEGKSLYELRKKLNILDKYDRLFEELLATLTTAGYLKKQPPIIEVSAAVKQELIDFNIVKSLEDLVRADSNYSGHVALLYACIGSFKDILLGKIKATDVIFPSGNFELVGNIYRSSYEAGYFNEILADVIHKNLAVIGGSLNNGKKIKILEFGAGVGGSSEVIFRKLLPFQNQIEYVYTDISRSFLVHAQETFGSIAPYMKTGLFNVEIPPSLQGFKEADFDIVLGTNAIHATKDILNSLGNIKALLKKDGVLLLNEIVCNDVFNTLTFGLLDGWWLFEDEEIRIKGCPALSTAGWGKTLNNAGFNNPAFYPGIPGLAQSIIAAVSDGIIDYAVDEKDNDDAEVFSEISNTSHVQLDLQTASQFYLKRVFSKILKWDEGKIDILTPFEVLGVDSILIGTLSKELSKDFGFISTSIFFEYNNIKEMAGYFQQTYPSFFAAVPPPILSIPPKENPDFQPQSLSDIRVTPQPVITQFNGYDHMHTDIAIIGVSGRYPGARNINEFWENLTAGKDSVTQIPKNRWDVDEYYDQVKGKEGKIYSRFGGFLEGIDEFDPLFFNISPAEAERMDPQERLFLQTVWEAIEDAGYAVNQLSSKPNSARTVKTGVYVGVMYEEYQLLSHTTSTPAVLGWSPSSIANRVSYFCDFDGPSMAIDTMCSSSLTAIHIACNDLLLGQASVAIAGGVNVSVHPNKYLMLSHGTFLSERGKCESFGDKGEGFVPSEGVGAVLLKLLKHAEADGDQIYGIIKGTAINHGGKTKGYTVPNPRAQSNVIKDAIKRAGVKVEDFSYIEAHGTGTILGDPIEVAGLVRAFDTDKKQFCSIGSVKSNIGHCESAAGVSGLTKVLLQLKHKYLVPSLHSSSLNANINFKSSPFKVQQTLEKWETQDGKLRLSGISGFGAGGSNAHIIIQEYKAMYSTPYYNNDPVIILLSARNADRLRVCVSNLRSHLLSNVEINLFDVAYTLQTGREAMEERLAIVSHTKEELIDQLNRYLQGDAKAMLSGNTRKDKAEFLLEGGAGQAYIRYAIENKEGRSLAQLWIKGVTVNWHEMYGPATPKRISLPTYPFAKERYWVSLRGNREGEASVKPTSLHPLIHRNESDFQEQKFRSLFNGNESFFADHKVINEKILPGVAYLELAREAGKISINQNICRLRDVTWLKPIRTGEQGTDMCIKLYPIGAGEISYEIFTGKGEAAQIHCQGKLNTIELQKPLPHDVNELQQRFSKSKNKEECYVMFKEMGLDYGKSFQGIETLYYNENEALSRINLPIQPSYLFQPNVLDSALQNIVFLNYSTHGLSLPFHLESVNLFKELPETFWSYAKKSKNVKHDAKINGYDIDLISNEGEVLVRFSNFVLLPLEKSSKSPDAWIQNKKGDLHLFGWDWQKDLVVQENWPVNKTTQLIFLVDGPAHLADKLKDALEIEVEFVNAKSETDLFVQILHKIKQLMNSRARINFIVLFNNDNYLDYEFLSGLIKTTQQESAHITGKLLSIETLSVHHIDNITKIIRSEINSNDPEVRYKNDIREVRLPKLITNMPINNRSIGIKEGGVYLITGGLGGLGLIFAEHISKTPNTTIILTGRKSLTDDQLKEVTTVENVFYYSCDISNSEDVAVLFNDIIKRFSKIDGVIHSAGISRNNVLLKKGSDEVAQVLSPKIQGIKNIDRATKGESLDFMVLFSSIASVLPMAGQSDYASSNAYLNSFAVYRNNLVTEGKRKGNTISIHWPFWKDGGMQIDKESIYYLQNQWGMLPLPTFEGLEVFEQLLRAGINQCTVTYGDYLKIEHKVFNKRSIVSAKQTEDSSVKISPSSDGKTLLKNVVDTLTEITSKLIKLDKNLIDLDDDFGDYGFESVLLTRFSNELNSYYKLELVPTIFYNYPTIEALANFLLSDHSELLKLKHESLVRVKEAEDNLSSEKIFPEPISYAGRFIKSAPAVQLPLPKYQASEPYVEPVAIVGISGRFPGSGSLEEFWENIRDNKNLITEVPESRWDWRKYYGDPKEDKTKTRVKWGGFIEDIDKFDPLFFGISPTEAEMMDPQQRITLQAVYHALEDAAISPASIRGTNTALFIGVMNADYATILSRNPDLTTEGQFLTGSAHSVLANRISYFLDLHGPSGPVDTGCSSALIAIHRAVENMRSGNCEMAIAGGVNAILSPEKTLLFTQLGLLSKDGKCMNFDQGANGFARGEGVGIVVLKPLSKALADGNPIYGLIRGSAENHGGKANTLSSPNPAAQKTLLIKAYRSAGVDPRHVSYIEAGGTGTSLGDTIEADALKSAFKELLLDKDIPTPLSPYCSIGCVKTNVGHLEAASGMAGIIKVLLSMKHSILPGNPNLAEPNKFLKLESSPFYLQKDTSAWIPENKPKIAGISSFGFGGSNAHIIIEEYPNTPSVPYNNNHDVIILLSARNSDRLKAQVFNLKEHLMSNEDVNIFDIAYTLQIGREAMEERLAMISHTNAELVNQLDSYLRGDTKHLLTGNIKKDRSDLLLESGAGQAYIRYAIEHQESASLAQLWVKGVGVNWHELYGETKPKRTSLPGYPFARERYWVPLQEEKNKKTLIQSPSQLPPLHCIESDLQVAKFTGMLQDKRDALADHKTVSEIIQPDERMGITPDDLSIIEDLLLEICSKQLKIKKEAFDFNTNFSEYGIESVLMVKILHAIERTFNIGVQPTVLITFPTISSLARHLFESGRIIFKEAIPELINSHSDRNNLEKESSQILAAPNHLQPDRHHPKIAIIGMSCRFPDAENLDDYWAHLVTNSRFENENTSDDFLQSNQVGVPTEIAVKGSYIKNPGMFDARYFNITDREAILMDPRERIVLELSRDLIAQAGYSKDELKDKLVGVYIGAKASSSYNNATLTDVEEIGKEEIHTIANNISDFYKFKGPGKVIDKSNLSSFSALNTACDEILSGHAQLAVAGGVYLAMDNVANARFDISGKKATTALNVESSETEEITEGSALFLLKEYELAKADGDQIMGVIVGRTIFEDNSSQDAQSNGQHTVFSSALQKANVQIKDISIQEFCASGAPSLDKSKMRDVQAAYNISKPEKHCVIGSCTIGTMISASGLAGIVKTLLQMKKKQLVPDPYLFDIFETDRHLTPFRQVKQVEAWDHEGKIAAVSLFNLDGSESHLIIEFPLLEKKPIRHELPVERLSNNFYWIGKESLDHNKGLRKAEKLGI